LQNQRVGISVLLGEIWQLSTNSGEKVAMGSVPRVSVLIPCFNAGRFIRETLESVVSQSWSNIEVIVVDDGSQDSSAQEVMRFNSRGVRLITQPNRGAGAARNAAFRASSGSLIQFLDADDLISPTKIELQTHRLIDNPDTIASAEWGRFQGPPSQVCWNPEPVWQDMAPLDWLAVSRSEGLGMLFPALWLTPRQIIEQAGPWDESLTLGDDGEYFTRVILNSRRVLFCRGARCYYRSGLTGSLSGKKRPEDFHSAFRVVELCQAHVLARENSERMKRAYSLMWQHLSHAAYPYAPSIAERAIERARQLHPVIIEPGGGLVFRVVSRLLGWRAARKLQFLLGRP
jgi:glycosyltransferase involved in cell wall biosynthesis